MLLLLSWYKFSDKKMQDSDVFYECVTDRQTDRQTNQQTDTASYRGALSHLKRERTTTNAIPTFTTFYTERAAFIGTW